MSSTDQASHVAKLVTQAYYDQPSIGPCLQETCERVLSAQPEFAPKVWIRMGDKTPDKGQLIYFIAENACMRGVWRRGHPLQQIDGKPDRALPYMPDGLWQPRYVPEIPVVKEDSIQERIQRAVKGHVFADMARKIMDDVTEIMKEYDIKKKST